MEASRRLVLQWLAGVPLAAAAPGGLARETSNATITRLIAQSRARAGSTLSQRIEFISRALRGVRYLGQTLIGGPRRPEQFVVRTDAFDCVTFCETVLAAALAKSFSEFETLLRTIRYAHGEIRWDDRNHYFAEWCRINIAHGFCRQIAMPRTITIHKIVHWKNQGRRRVTIVAVPRASLLANAKRLANGDIIGFLSRRANLDFFHVGFVMLGPKGRLLLRHASEIHKRVLDVRLDHFLFVNRVRYVTLLRPVEGQATARGS